jgi:glycosyltransferase involved in cell wall biosynthesis
MNSQFERLLKKSYYSGPLISSFEKKICSSSSLEENDCPETPLVSCIMPTVNRAKFIEQSLVYFEAQDYPNKELVIVYENESDLPVTSLPKHVRIKKVMKGTSIGEKRNIAFGQSKGMFIAQWDDDDVYSPQRLSVQLKPIIDGTAEITSFNDVTFFDYENWRFWKCSPSLMERMFVHSVAGGALVYHRKCFYSSRYPNTSLREDADFLCSVMKYGNRLTKLSAEGLYLYLRHSNNTWKFETGQFLSKSDWYEVKATPFIKKYIPWYDEIKSVKTEIKGNDQPKVSCIMPTYNRRHYVKDAIQHFLDQDYTNKELIIIDDGTDPIKEMIPSNTEIRYYRLSSKLTIGEKRNMANAKASGEIIVHFDDDDWYQRTWISQIVNKLLRNVDVTGLSTLYFKSDKLKQAWVYKYPNNSQAWVHGATFGYWRHVWEKHPFSSINIGEDNQFLWDKQGLNISPINFLNGYIGNVHSHNTSPKYTASERWETVNYETVQNMLTIK